ncbi:MAG: hypothetical protein IH958_01595 [Chloroflexi bacterium]|nr:hypothetical protein [Chloroflexota bacterium]
MEEQGPFDRILQPESRPQGDRSATFIVAITIILGLLLLVLVLPPISIFDDGDGPDATGPITTQARAELPPPPDGFQSASALFDVSAPGRITGPARISVPLSTTLPEGSSVDLFTFRDNADDWRRLGSGTVLAGGVVAQAELPILPPNIAVMRPSDQTHLVLGVLPPGAALDPAARAVLTTLTPAGFSLAPNGAISGAALSLPDDLETPIVPTISARTEAEVETLDAILGSSERRAAHVQAIVDFTATGGYAGVDLDYRLGDQTLEDEFVELVQALSAGLRANGQTLILSLPLPERQAGAWVTFGYDWPALAPLAGTIKLSTVDDQDRYFQRMEEALTFLTAQVPSGKLLLPLSALSRERGVLGVRALTLTEALTLASVPVAQPQQAMIAPEASVRAVGQNLSQELGGSALRWDDTARAVIFSYAGLGGQRTVWIANVFSAAFKVDLARRYQLGGIALDDVSDLPADANLWPVLAQYAESGEAELVRPNDSLLEPQWSATGGTLTSATGVTTSWLAPAEPGSYSLTLIVSDGVIRIGQRLVLEVGVPPGAAAP